MTRRRPAEHHACHAQARPRLHRSPLDSSDRYGYAGADPADPQRPRTHRRRPARLLAATACAREPVRAGHRRDGVAQASLRTGRRGRWCPVRSSRTRSDCATLALPREAVMAVLRPAALLLPADVLRATLERARQAQLDVAMVEGDLARGLLCRKRPGARGGGGRRRRRRRRDHPARHRTPARLGLSAREVPLAVARLTAEEVGWAGRALAEALAASPWKEWPAAPLLELDSPAQARRCPSRAGGTHSRATGRQLLQRARRSSRVTIRIGGGRCS